MNFKEFTRKAVEEPNENFAYTDTKSETTQGFSHFTQMGSLYWGPSERTDTQRCVLMNAQLQFHGEHRIGLRNLAPRPINARQIST